MFLSLVYLLFVYSLFFNNNFMFLNEEFVISLNFLLIFFLFVQFGKENLKFLLLKKINFLFLTYNYLIIINKKINVKLKIIVELLQNFLILNKLLKNTCFILAKNIFFIFKYFIFFNDYLQIKKI